MPDTAENTPVSPSANTTPDDSRTQSGQAAREWLDMLSAGTKLLRAGLRREVGPSGDVDAAYRRWYAAQMQEHDRKVQRVLQRLRKAEAEHAP